MYVLVYFVTTHNSTGNVKGLLCTCHPYQAERYVHSLVTTVFEQSFSPVRLDGSGQVVRMNVAE